MSGDVDRFVIHSRLWPRFLRWAIALQIGLAFVLGLNLVLRGLRGAELMPSHESESLAITSVSLAMVAYVMAVRRRNMDAAEITLRGIRTLSPRMFHHWDQIGTVRLQAGLFGNQWLQVTPNYSPPFTLAAHPTNPVDVFDALERFAGPDHPLTQAYATLDADRN